MEAHLREGGGTNRVAAVLEKLLQTFLHKLFFGMGIIMADKFLRFSIVAHNDSQSKLLWGELLWKLSPPPMKTILWELMT